MLLEVLRAAGGFLILMFLWFGVQAWVRRSKGAPRSTDVLDHVKHGCGGCPEDPSCGTCAKPTDKQHLTKIRG